MCFLFWSEGERQPRHVLGIISAKRRMEDIFHFWHQIPQDDDGVELRVHKVTTPEGITGS